MYFNLNMTCIYETQLLYDNTHVDTYEWPFMSLARWYTRIFHWNSLHK